MAADSGTRFYPPSFPLSGLIPLRLIRQRTVACCCVFSALYGAANITHVTLLPTYLQTVHGISATLSGVFQLPITFSNIASMTAASLVISARGHFLPFLCAGPLVYLVGAVLFQQLRTTSGPAWYIGATVPIGAGFGLAIHSSVLAIQAACSPEDMPLAVVLEIFSQQLGRAVGISIAQSVYLQKLQQGLGAVPATGVGVTGQSSGLQELVSSMQGMVPARQAEVREALNSAITAAFILPVAATAGAAVSTWFVERRTLDVAKKPTTPRAGEQVDMEDMQDATSRSAVSADGGQGRL